MCGAIDHVMREIKNETNMIDEKMHKVTEIDNDTLHLINDKLKEIINQSRKKLSKIVVNKVATQIRLLCHKTLERISTAKISE